MGKNRRRKRLINFWNIFLNLDKKLNTFQNLLLIFRGREGSFKSVLVTVFAQVVKCISNLDIQ